SLRSRRPCCARSSSSRAPARSSTPTMERPGTSSPTRSDAPPPASSTTAFTRLRPTPASGSSLGERSSGPPAGDCCSTSPRSSGRRRISTSRSFGPWTTRPEGRSSPTRKWSRLPLPARALFPARHPLPPAAPAGAGRDRTAEIRAADGVYLGGYAPTRYQGIVEPHDLVLEMPEARRARKVVLYLTGWILYSDT